jgi:hypothetical protein
MTSEVGYSGFGVEHMDIKINPMDVQIGGNHYKNFKIQPAEFITKNELPFLEGCVIKRMCRHRGKNGIEDLRKAKHEIDMIIASYDED